ncbi:hypothetical protein Pint_09090 [Pistacia integerrima]|uniref:Uncharacterized protein n=1 Tax=Pistacia integerrima TaxID=434235 RepID=A0ACC0XU49_9ROSI|nr:hypothetical protein Pint_09090 [Pistacia integerrima]
MLGKKELWHQYESCIFDGLLFVTSKYTHLTLVCFFGFGSINHWFVS